MIRDVNLIEYLPLFIQEFREIKHTMDAENPEFQLVIDESEKIKNNQFIESSDLVGIVKFEKILNIIPLADDTLLSRISRIMTRWNDVVPYTYRALVQKLIQLCDGLNFTINKNFNEYEMEIITHLELPGQVDNLQYLLGFMIPSNLLITSKNEIYCDSFGLGRIAAGVAFCEFFDLTDSFKAEFNVQGSSIMGGGYIGTVEVSISDNYNETITITGDSKVGSGVTYTSTIGIK